jgi:hypothetical protein
MLLFFFFLFHDLNLELGLPVFLFSFKKLCRFGCFHARDNIPSINPIQMWSSILSDVDNVHLQSSNILDVDVSQFMNGEAKVRTWIPHIHMFIYLGFLAINNMLPMDFVKLQVLQCIICKCK